MLQLLCPLCHYRKTTLPPTLHFWLLGWLLKEAWDLLQSRICAQALPGGLDRQLDSPKWDRKHGWLQCLLSHPMGYFFLISLAKSGDPCCPHRPTWQLLEEPDMCQVVRGFSCSQARVAAVERTGEVQAERTAALYICHIKLRAPSLAFYQLLACC